MGIEFTKEELKFIDDVFGHINYDAKESHIFWSICSKLKIYEDKLRIQGEIKNE